MAVQSAYLANLRARAMSVLAGVQRLEDLDAVPSDELRTNVEASLESADEAVWSVVDWIEKGRPA